MSAACFVAFLILMCVQSRMIPFPRLAAIDSPAGCDVDTWYYNHRVGSNWLAYQHQQLCSAACRHGRQHVSMRRNTSAYLSSSAVVAATGSVVCLCRPAPLTSHSTSSWLPSDLLVNISCGTRLPSLIAFTFSNIHSRARKCHLVQTGCLSTLPSPRAEECGEQNRRVGKPVQERCLLDLSGHDSRSRRCSTEIHSSARSCVPQLAR